MGGMARTGPNTIAVWDGPVEYEITVGPVGSDIPELVAWLVAQGADAMPALSGFGDWLGKALDWITTNGPKVTSAIKTVKGVAGQKSAMRRACEASGPTPTCCAWARNPPADPLYPNDVQVYCSGTRALVGAAGLGGGLTSTQVLIGLAVVGGVLLLAGGGGGGPR